MSAAASRRPDGRRVIPAGFTGLAIAGGTVMLTACTDKPGDRI